MVTRGMGIERGRAQRDCEAFTSCRNGLEIADYNENLEQLINEAQSDFIITPIASPRSLIYDDDPKLIPDLVLDADIWSRQVAVSVGPQPLISYDTENATRFDQVFRHAIYLPSPCVLLHTPRNTVAQAVMASVINERLKQVAGRPVVLFRIPIQYHVQATQNKSGEKKQPGSQEERPNAHQPQRSPENKRQTLSSSATNNQLDELATLSITTGANTSVSDSQEPENAVQLSWKTWNSIRNDLEPDPRVGVCLELDNSQLDFAGDKDLLKWVGEPVRMIILNKTFFTSTKNCVGSTRVVGRVKEFIRQILVSNSFMTSFVIKQEPGVDIKGHLGAIAALCQTFEYDHPDDFRAWNDLPLSPLQPLSINLDSNTYNIFEMDRVKYQQYQQAEKEALKFLIKNHPRPRPEKYIIMVLGAGRGPLVDAMIEAIKQIPESRRYNFKIYALDKNHSSVRSLKYKSRCVWSEAPSNIEVEVVEADMRYWEPGVKADIIVTELLGSFSDNELSPECIDGTHRFSTPDTISIPQEYTSLIAPIQSYKMHQIMYSAREMNTFDRIHVVRLSNYYMISEPQELFKFQHINLSREPTKEANQRTAKLSFHSEVQTVCHGFAGFFDARLFGKTYISTVPSRKTPSMESWFPTFIPIEKPVQVLPSSNIEILFSRKDSDTKVWYEWLLLSPEKSRIHSPNGLHSAMSKTVDS